MNAVGLKQFGPITDAREKERHQCDLFSLRNPLETRGKLFAVGTTVVGRHHHAEQQRLRADLFRRLDHGAKILLGAGQRQAAQGVIAAKLDHDHRRLMPFKQLRQPRLAAGGGLAADAGVDHFIGQTPFSQSLAHQRDPSRPSGQAIFGRQTVAKHQQLFRHRVGQGRAAQVGTHRAADHRCNQPEQSPPGLSGR